jgi:dGTPase
LALNEDLVEAIALAHDLGHTPFGHAGQDELNDCMTGHGGFEHNLQSLRVVDYLEARYPAFDGLNLTFETREGVLKHCSRANAERLEAAEPQGVAHRFLARAQPSLEAQLCNLADEIAYNAHDIDDGVRSGLITMEQLQAVPLFENFRLQTLQEFPQLLEQHSHRKLLYESIRRMLSAQVYDVIRSTQEVLNAHTLPDAQAVRQCPPLVCFSAAMREQSTELKQFLYANLYRHPQVMATTAQARQVIRDLFEVYRQRHTEMPLGFAERAQQAHSEGGMLRVVADFIAGMTDRFAWREHERLTGLRLLA